MAKSIFIHKKKNNHHNVMDERKAENRIVGIIFIITCCFCTK